jgi:hypothetical protein
MKKFLVLFKWDPTTNPVSVSELFAKAPPEQMKAGMAAWTAWYDKCGGAIVDRGSPVDHAQRMTETTTKPIRSDTTGYVILSAESAQDALMLMRGHPHFHAPGTSIEVLEMITALAN